jgi:glycosyltransferase involved in cell wall biosynthesis
MKIDFCLPAHNETQIIEKNIEKLLTYCRGQKFFFEWQIVIIVNGSDDEFQNLTRKISEKNQQIKTVIYPEKGKGLAIKKYALESESDIYVYMDMDLSVAIEYLPLLINPIIDNQADIVCGSRMLPESKKERSIRRELVSQSYVWLSRMILKHNFSDLQCGFKAIKTPLLKKLSTSIKDDYWFFDTELICLAKAEGAKIKEIPIDWSENRYEIRKSKINLFQDSFVFFYKLLEFKLKDKKQK